LAGITKVLFKLYWLSKTKSRIVVFSLLHSAAIFACHEDPRLTVARTLDQPPTRSEQGSHGAGTRRA
jgi:hypothetical protein